MSDKLGHNDILRKLEQREIVPEAAAKMLDRDSQSAGRAIRALCHNGELGIRQAKLLLTHVNSETKAVVMSDALGHLGANMSPLAAHSSDARLLEYALKAGGNFDAAGVEKVRQFLQENTQPYAGPISIVASSVPRGRLTEALGGDAELAARVKSRGQLSLMAGERPDAGEHAAGLVQRDAEEREPGGGRFC